MTGIRKKLILYAMIALLAWKVPVAADEQITVAGTYTGTESVSVYVKGMEDVTEVGCQIGAQTGQSVTIEKVSDMELPSKTLVLLDNSLSIKDANREKIREFLLELVDNKDEQELIAIATFGKELTNVIDYTADESALKTAINKIEYQKQNTYLTDILYEILKQDHMGTEDCYRRIIVISDGMDSKEIGYTKDELYSVVKEKGYPIYSLGCVSKDNNEQLKNMYALSRMTGALEVTLDDVEDTNALVDEFAEDNKVMRLVVYLTESERDGAEKNLLFTLQTATGEQQLDAKVKMPFAVTEDVKVQESEEQKASVDESSEEDNEEEEENEERENEEKENNKYKELLKNKNFLLGLILVAVAVVALIVLVIVIVLVTKKKKKSKKSIPEPFLTNVANLDDDRTVVLTDSGLWDDERTVVLMDNDTKVHQLCMTDIHDSSRMFKVPLRESVVIGRKTENVNLVIDYDKTISSRHCQISERNGRFYLKDLQSANGTLLNGMRVLGEEEIYSGCTVTLGRVEMKVEIL